MSVRTSAVSCSHVVPWVASVLSKAAVVVAGSIRAAHPADSRRPSSWMHLVYKARQACHQCSRARAIPIRDWTFDHVMSMLFACISASIAAMGLL